MKRYESVAQYVENQIQRGVWQANMPLPSLRLLSQQLDVSKNTVIRAYQSLEDKGLVSSQERSGFYIAKSPFNSQHTSKSLSPCKVTLGALAQNIIHAPANHHLVPMGSANPDGRFPARRKFYRMLAQQSRLQAQSPERVSYYAASPGLLELREQIAQRYRSYLETTHANDIVITSGAQEAITLALRALTQAGDIVVVESPSFYGTLQCIETLGLQVLEIPTNHNGMDLALLEQSLERWDVKVILTNHCFNNPMGFTMPDVNKRQLLALAESHDTAIIEDDVSAELYYTGQRPLPIKYFDSQGRVLLCSSFSKTLDSSCRLGWILAGRYHDKVNYLKYVTSMGSPAIIQSAAAHFLQDQTYERHLRYTRRVYKERQRYLLDEIHQHWSTKVTTYQGYGGYLMWVELPKHLCGLEVYKRALQQGISITPGMLFSSQNQFKNCIRLNYSALESNEENSKAIQQLGDIIQQLDS